MLLVAFLNDVGWLFWFDLLCLFTMILEFCTLMGLVRLIRLVRLVWFSLDLIAGLNCGALLVDLLVACLLVVCGLLCYVICWFYV